MGGRVRRNTHGTHADDPTSTRQGGPRGAGAKDDPARVHPVDFPAFVASLIEGVFPAIVDASIAQMKAHGDLLASVTTGTSDTSPTPPLTASTLREQLVAVLARDHEGPPHRWPPKG